MKYCRILVAMAFIGVIAGCSDDTTVNSKPKTGPRYDLSIARISWHHCSAPAEINPVVSARAQFAWYNPLAQVPITDIWPDWTPGPGEQTVTNVLAVGFQAVDHNTAGPIVPEKSWNGFMAPFPWSSATTVIDPDTIEIILKGDIGVMHIDLGQINEDINGNGKFDTEDKFGNFILYPELDFGLDGVFDAQEPGYNQNSNPDPDGDDWVADTNITGGIPWKINGTEKNANDPDGGYIPDTEDPDYDGLDTVNAYFSYRVDLADTTESFYVPGSRNAHGWKTLRIPIKDFHSIESIIGEPSWDEIKHVRIWFDSFPAGDPVITQIARMKIIPFGGEKP